MLITGPRLEQLVREGLFPYDEAVHVGTSSIDVRLGDTFKIGGTGAYVTLGNGVKPIYEGFSEKKVPEGGTIVIEPGKLYIAHTKEYVRLPADVGAFLLLRSSLGRRGLDHLHSGWLEPGWEGQITLELTAVVPTELRVGERIAQMVLIQATDPAPYTGRYNGQRGPTLAL